jgi:Protein of unknown function (DUF1566)
MKTILRLFILLGFVLVVPGMSSFGQVGINTDGLAPDPSAGLDVKFNNKGFLPPRMTHTQLNNISSPADGLVVYCTDCGSNGLGTLSIFMGGTWYKLSIDCLNPLSPPTPGTHIPTCCQIEFHWNSVPGATGYKVSINNNYAAALDVGNVLTAIVPDCAPSTWYSGYVWAYNDCGHSTPIFLSCQTLSGICVGLLYEGGRIFYLDGSGNGLIAANSDQGNSLPWMNPATSVATSTDIGQGQANTDLILAGPPPGQTNNAAYACDIYSSDGYNDWFLPSKDELDQLYLQRSYFHNPFLSDGTYWSSSEYNATDAWTQDFSTGGKTNTSKVSTGHALAIRKFFLIGDSFGGGKIFYVDGTGQHGLIAAPSDQSTGAQWGCSGTLISGTGTAIGTGQGNTAAIVAGCGTAGIAARICDTLTLNGHTDWFLPSQEELNQMYIHKNEIGGFADYGYWSSSESSADNAWGQGLGTGPQFVALKSSTFKVRAIRAF